MTSETLIKSVKRRAMIPENQNTFLEEDFLSFANEEMDIGVVPHVLQYHEEFFVYTQNLPLVANVSRYQIPGRAVGNRLREIAYEDTSGNIFEMTRITIEDLPLYQNNSTSARLRAFYIEGDEVVLVPDISSNPGGFLRASFYLRPNELVTSSRVAIITGIDRISGNITVNQIPTNISVTTPIDLVQVKSPHRTLGLDLTAVSINTITKTVTMNLTDIPTALGIGDQIALAGESIVPQIPTDLHSMLAQRVAARCLEALGDANGLNAANAKLQEMEIKTGSLIDNRVEGSPLKLVNRNGLLSASRRWR